MSSFEKTNLNRVKRIPKRGHYDKATIYPIIDAALICHVGLVHEGQPIVIPTIHARLQDNIIIHGASTSRLMNNSGGGNAICITITHLDGLVLARSAFHHSMNYRSAVIYGQGEIILDHDEKMAALEAITEKLVPGRWNDVRQPSTKELKATNVVKIPIDLASAKIRTGPPGDDKPDYNLDVWAGVMPMRTVFGKIEPDPALKKGIEVPDYIMEYALIKK
ncbi:MAG: pyridoxamine 5'-phosphate oxidase family protein [Saprospiraceae bacterium]